MVLFSYQFFLVCEVAYVGMCYEVALTTVPVSSILVPLRVSSADDL